MLLYICYITEYSSPPSKYPTHLPFLSITYYICSPGNILPFLLLLHRGLLAPSLPFPYLYTYIYYSSSSLHYPLLCSLPYPLLCSLPYPLPLLFRKSSYPLLLLLSFYSFPPSPTHSSVPFPTHSSSSSGNLPTHYYCYSPSNPLFLLLSSLLSSLLSLPYPLLCSLPYPLPLFFRKSSYPLLLLLSF